MLTYNIFTTLSIDISKINHLICKKGTITMTVTCTTYYRHTDLNTSNGALTHRYYVRDYLGSVRAVFDLYGNLEQTNDYESAYLIPTTTEQDNIIRTEFIKISKTEDYSINPLAPNHCGTAVQRSLQKAGIKVTSERTIPSNGTSIGKRNKVTPFSQMIFIIQ